MKTETNNVVDLPQRTPKFELHYVHPGALHDWWDTVEAHIEECRINDPDDPWLQDVYTAIRNGTAFLHVGLIDDKYVGMTVSNILVDPFSGRKKYNIWYLNCREGVDFLKMALPQVEAAAKSAGADKLLFIATRAGFQRWAEPLGFELAEIKMVKELY